VLLKVCREASQVGEQTTSLVERHFFLFVELYEEERTDEISEEISRSSVGRWILRGARRLRQVWKGSKLRRAER
jgi:hypothetical protein